MIHTSEDITTIKEQINKLGHKVRNIIYVRHKTTKDPLLLYFIDLEPHPNNRDIYEIKKLGHYIVSFEPSLTRNRISYNSKDVSASDTLKICVIASSDVLNAVTTIPLPHAPNHQILLLPVRTVKDNTQLTTKDA